MKLRNTSRQEFIAAITPDPADVFAKTFVSKADSFDLWNNCYGLWVDNDLCGAIITTISKREPKIANLQLLHTFSKFRKMGVATVLCNQSLQFAIENDAQYYRVSAEPDAVKFYEKIGFKFLGRQKSNCQLSIFKINGSSFNEGIYTMVDDVIRKAVYKKGKGGCVEVFV